MLPNWKILIVFSFPSFFVFFLIFNATNNTAPEFELICRNNNFVFRIFSNHGLCYFNLNMVTIVRDYSKYISNLQTFFFYFFIISQNWNYILSNCVRISREKTSNLFLFFRSLFPLLGLIFILRTVIDG